MRYFLFRIAGGLLTVFVSSLLVFGLVRFIPGDPAAALLGRAFDPALAKLIRARLGLDGSFTHQYFNWFKALVHGDFGYSFINGAPVGAQLFERLIRTLQLLGGGVLVGLLIAIPAGMISARHKGKVQDSGIMAFTTLMLSIPQFVLGIFLIYIFGVRLHWLPAGGWVDPSQDLGGWFKAMILPWTCVGMAMSAFTARVLRASILDARNMDFTRTARSWGLSEEQIDRKHVYRNASIPTITVVGLEIGYLIGGAFVIEKVFAYPGIGQMTVESISSRDYPMVQAAILLFSLGFIVVNLVVDLIYGIVDPRIRQR
jgi:peptide/nickel transport system permease protein